MRQATPTDQGEAFASASAGARESSPASAGMNDGASSIWKPPVAWGGGAWSLALWAVPVLALLLWALAWRGVRARRAFFGPRSIGSTPSSRRWARPASLVAAAALLGVALARPQSAPRETRATVSGRDLVVLLDVSRSMLARDVAPSRLGRAKVWINDLASAVRGDRVALVLFAGASTIACPLTLDQSYFRLALDEASPASVPRGGTLIGDAIRRTLADVVSDEGRPTDIILITDGEDHESFPIEAAVEAGKRGVRIIALGIGGEAEGAPVPASTEEDGRPRPEYLEHAGGVVRSKMDPKALAAIAHATPGGVLLNVGTGTINLDRVYADLIATAERAEIDDASALRYTEQFQIPLTLAIAALLGEMLAAGWRRRAPDARASSPRPGIVKEARA